MNRDELVCTLPSQLEARGYEVPDFPPIQTAAMLSLTLQRSARIESEMRESILDMIGLWTGVFAPSESTGSEIAARSSLTVADIRRVAEVMRGQSAYQTPAMPARGIPRPMFSFKSAGTTEAECLDELYEKLPPGVTPEMMAAGKRYA